MVNLCIPTLNQYELLPGLISSAEKGSLIPSLYYVIDNGAYISNDTLQKIRDVCGNKFVLAQPGHNIGVAKSWNWFITNVSEIRIITNDDILFGENTIKDICESVWTGNYLVGLDSASGLNLFSLFAITDKCVREVGVFDETISPNYAYFEDNDYHRRMQLLGINDSRVAGNIVHIGSATIKAYTEMEREIHHMKFNIAKRNYFRKWGGLPGEEMYLIPYNKGKL